MSDAALLLQRSGGWPDVTTRFSEIRYTVRALIHQSIGHCEEVQRRDGGLPDPLVAGINEIGAVARTIAGALDASRLNTRQLDGLGRSLLALSVDIGRRVPDLM